MEKDILTNLIGKNYSQHEIARELNCSQSNIRYWLKKYDLKTNKRDNIKPILQFCRICLKSYKKGHGEYKNLCKVCRVTNNRQQTKYKAVKYMGGKCQDCGYNKCIQALHFHHIDKSLKKFAISENNYSWPNIQNELKKCILLCSNCHAERHYALKA